MVDSAQNVVRLCQLGYVLKRFLKTAGVPASPPCTYEMRSLMPRMRFIHIILLHLSLHLVVSSAVSFAFSPPVHALPFSSSSRIVPQGAYHLMHPRGGVREEVRAREGERGSHIFMSTSSASRIASSFTLPSSLQTSSPAEALRQGSWFKLICGASNQDTPQVCVHLCWQHSHF